MFHIESIARELVPQLCDNKTLSIICISTANPVYLFFDGHRSYPEFVVRISEYKDFSVTHRVLEELFKTMGDLVPQPISLSNRDNLHIVVEKGLKGVPWFQLAKNYTTPSQWSSLRNKANNTLNQLHLAISEKPQWNRVCFPGEELRQCYQECLESGTRLPPELQEQVELCSRNLDAIGEISVHSQHGDFCLNNLIIEENKIHIIDFEDFGITSMPLHDQFTLALSFYQLSPGDFSANLSSEIKIFVSSALKKYDWDNSILSGLFMHHLLLRLGSWSQHRKQYRHWLLEVMNNFIHSPDTFFSNNSKWTP